MKDSDYPKYYDFRTLRFIRDNKPSEEEILAYFGGELWQSEARFAELKRSGLVTKEGERWTLLPDRVSSDGKTFRWGNQTFWLDDELIYTY